MVEELLSALDAEPQTGEADTGSEAQKTAPVRIGSERPSGEIRLLYLRHLSPGDAVAAIAPLVIGPPVFSGPVGSPTFSGAEVHRVSGPTFVTVTSQLLLIVRGDADALKKVEELIQAIDVPGAATGVAPDSAAKSGRQLAPNSISHVYRFHDSNWLEIVGALQEMRNRAGAEWFEMRSQPDENLLAIGGSAAMLEVVGKTIKRFYPKSELIVKVDNKTVAEIRVFALKHATASDVAKALENVRPEGHVNVSADARTNSVVVTGPPEALQLVERFIALLDVPAKDFKRPLDAERLFAIAQQLRQTGMDVDVVPGFSSPVAQLRTAA
ncbi:MAG: secretin N-terminal domain-containing protein, partial [Planctomycetaceae bacterium]